MTETSADPHFPALPEVFGALMDLIRAVRTTNAYDEEVVAQEAIERLQIRDLYPTEDPRRLFQARNSFDIKEDRACRCSGRGLLVTDRGVTIRCYSCNGKGNFHVESPQFTHVLDVAFWAALGCSSIIRIENIVREEIARHGRKYQIPKNTRGRILWRCSSKMYIQQPGRIIWPEMSYARTPIVIKELEPTGIFLEPVIEDIYRLTLHTPSYLYT